MASRKRENQFIPLLTQEVAVYPGRLAGSLRDTLSAVLAITIAMTLRVPGVSGALALMFLMQRERPGLTFRAAVQFYSGAVAACFASFFWVQVTDGTDVMRFLGVVICIFISAFCMAATTIPPFWTIFGYYGLASLAAWDSHHSSHAIVTSSLFNLASLGLVILCAVGVEYLFGTRHPSEELEKEINKRLITLGHFFKALAESESDSPESRERIRASHHLLVRYAHAGDPYLNELYNRLADPSRPGQSVPLGIHYRIGLLTRILNKSVLLGFPGLREQMAEHRDTCRSIAGLCHAMVASPASPELVLPVHEDFTPLGGILLELEQYVKSLRPGSKLPPPSPTEPIPQPFPRFVRGAFRSPNAAFYALKLTLATTICYILYNAVAWPGIFTCAVTVIFTGLSSTGAMRQKQLYRFLGAAIGGALGIATVCLLYPNTDSITSLVVISAPIAFLSGWVLRSPRIGYVGVQIGFAFFLTAVPGFTATTRFEPARDRLVGIGLGILVTWFVFDQLWPARTSDALKGILVRIRKATIELEKLRQLPAAPQTMRLFQDLRSSVSMELANMQQLDFAVHFEGGRHRKREQARSRRLIREIEKSSADFYTAALQISPM